MEDESEREIVRKGSGRWVIYLSSAPFAVRVHVVPYGQVYFRVVWGMGLSHLKMRSLREKCSSLLVFIHNGQVGGLAMKCKRVNLVVRRVKARGGRGMITCSV